MDASVSSMLRTSDLRGRANDTNIHRKHELFRVIGPEAPSTLRASRAAHGTRFACPDSFGSLIGSSAAMHAVYAALNCAAPTQAPVLLLGESGTGKELAARALHAASQRAHKPFEVVDCGGLSPALVESELFGHERGSFTGADRERGRRVRTRRWRHALSRRARRAARPGAAQALAGSRRARDPTRWGKPLAARGCAHRSRHQPRPRQRSPSRLFSERPVLPPGRDTGPNAASARAARRPPSTGRIVVEIH